MVLSDNMKSSLYDWVRGWEDDHPFWHTHVINAQTESDLDKLHKEVVLWLYKNINNPERHCRWIRLDTKVSVKFRHEKDYLWFTLSF
jgi:hypothetical protein